MVLLWFYSGSLGRNWDPFICASKKTKTVIKNRDHRIMCSHVFMIHWHWLKTFWNLIISAPQVFWNWCQHYILSLLNSSVWVSNSWGFYLLSYKDWFAPVWLEAWPRLCFSAQTAKPSWMATWSSSWAWCGRSSSTTPSPCPCGRMKETMMPRSRRQSRGCLGGFRTRSPTCPSPTSTRTGKMEKPWEPW